jgi:hypothetical protein
MAKITYRTINPHSGTIIIKQRIVGYYKVGKAIKHVKAKLRYCEDLAEVFVHRQEENAQETPQETTLMIKNGKFSFDDSNLALVEFMEKHKNNVINGGNLFIKVDVKKDALYEVQKYEARHDAETVILEANETVLRTIMLYMVNPTKTEILLPVLKKELMAKVQKDEKFCKEVIVFVEAKDNEEKYMIINAIKEGLIYVRSGKVIAWKDSNEPIFRGSQSKDALLEFAQYLKTEDGRNVMSSLASKLDIDLEKDVNYEFKK